MVQSPTYFFSLFHSQKIKIKRKNDAKKREIEAKNQK